jgi:hypothetical protein
MYILTRPCKGMMDEIDTLSTRAAKVRESGPLLSHVGFNHN